MEESWTRKISDRWKILGKLRRCCKIAEEFRKERYPGVNDSKGYVEWPENLTPLE
jgi:hypothetical protein